MPAKLCPELIKKPYNFSGGLGSNPKSMYNQIAESLSHHTRWQVWTEHGIRKNLFLIQIPDALLSVGRPNNCMMKILSMSYNIDSKCKSNGSFSRNKIKQYSFIGIDHIIQYFNILPPCLQNEIKLSKGH